MVTSEAAGKVETTGGTYMWRLEAWKKRKILGMIYAEFWSSKISVPSGSRRIRHLVVSPGGRPWVHKPGQYCRDRYEGAKSGTRNEESAEPIITTGEGEESPRMILHSTPKDESSLTEWAKGGGVRVWGSTQFLSGTKRLIREWRFKPQRWEFPGEFQRLGLCAFTAKGLGSIPGRGARIPQIVKGSQNKTHRGEGWSSSPQPLPQQPAPVQPKGH